MTTNEEQLMQFITDYLSKVEKGEETMNRQIRDEYVKLYAQAAKTMQTLEKQNKK